MRLVFAIMFFLVGLMLGSFLNMAIYRSPRGLTWRGRSFCDYCHKTLKFRDLIPVLSWVINRGKTRCCGKPLDARYPLVELMMGIVCAVIAYILY